MIPDPSLPANGSAESLYNKLTTDRDPYLRRARDVAMYTIPAEVPPDGYTGSTELYKPYQGMGARCVNNLASRFMLTLLPPTRRFARLMLEDKVANDLTDEEKQQFEKGLSGMEETIFRRMEKIGLRIHAAEALLHLVVAGNSLLFVGKDHCKMYRIWQYVVRRDSVGNIRDLVVKESVAVEELPEEMQKSIREVKGVKDPKVNLYTHVTRENGIYKVVQEACGIEVPGSRGTYGKTCPWLALRWKRDGGDWSRSYCDDYIGDLISGETLSRSIVRFAAIAAKIVFLVRPNAVTDTQQLNQAEEGEYVEGEPDDVAPIKMEKFPDFQIARATLDDVNTRLSYAFLLNSAIRRQGERVTAEEIRYMASELEDALGGVYSVLSLEFQLPLVQVMMHNMTADGTLPSLPRDTVRPTIVTGLDALGRSHELARLDEFIGGALKTFGPEVLTWIRMPDYLQRRAIGLDLTNPDSLVRTEDEVNAARQQAQAAEMAKAAMPNVVNAAAEQMAPQGT
jgi:hypothetical protein